MTDVSKINLTPKRWKKRGHLAKIIVELKERNQQLKEENQRIRVIEKLLKN